MTDLALENVTVVPMDSDRHLSAHSVVIRGDRIAWIGPASAAPPLTGPRIDGRGKYLMPGLADVHVHVGTENALKLLVAHGVTTIRNMAGMPRHLRWRERIARGEMLAPTLHTVGRIVDGRPAMRPRAISAVTQEEAERAVAATRRAGYEAVKVYDHLAPSTYGAIVESASRHEIPVVGHVPFRVGLPNVIAARQRTVEHLSGYVEAMQPDSSPLRTLVIEPGRARRLLAEGMEHVEWSRLGELADATRAAGTWNCPTLMVRRRYLQTADELSARAEMRYVPDVAIERWRRFKKLNPYPPSQHARQLEVYRELVRLLWKATGRILLGTDTPQHFMVAGAASHEELGELVAAGLTPFEALCAATRNAAEYLGGAEDWGTVAVGKQADLLLVDGDPLRDVANARKIAGVLLRGRWLPRSMLDATLDEVALTEQSGGIAADERAPQATRTPLGAGSTRFQISLSGRRFGSEDVSVERRTDGSATVIGHGEIGSALSAAWEPGTYGTRIDVAVSGIDQAATLTSETADGGEDVDLVRTAQDVLVRRSEPAVGLSEERHAAAADVLFGRLTASFLTRLALRLTTLRVGERINVDLLGPGVPPDYDIATTVLDVERVASAADDRSYHFEATRSNAVYGGTLRSDADGALLEAQLVPSALGSRDSSDEVERRLRAADPVRVTRWTTPV